MFMVKLVNENPHLWEQVVEHELITDMMDDTLPIERFRDYMLQLRLVVGEGLRNILCRLLADSHPDQGIAVSIVSHIQSVQPGGDHFEAISEMLHATGSHETIALSGHPHSLPPTEALCDYLYLIGLRGTLHEKILAIATLVEITHARFTLARDRKKLPMNPIYSSWFAHHSAAILRPRLDWLHKALDGTLTNNENWESDNHMFRRIVQLVILMNDAVRNRGRNEWPVESKYYHRKE
jgi:thiaminase